jgi:hypothetical protein
MANMNYCRFQNTELALRDCAADLEERLAGESEPLSGEESEAQERLFETMAVMFEAVGVDVDVRATVKALKEAA